MNKFSKYLAFQYFQHDCWYLFSPRFIFDSNKIFCRFGLYENCKTVQALFTDVRHIFNTEDKQKPNFNEKNMYSDKIVKVKDLYMLFYMF